MLWVSAPTTSILRGVNNSTVALPFSHLVSWPWEPSVPRIVPRYRVCIDDEPKPFNLCLPSVSIEDYKQGKVLAISLWKFSCYREPANRHMAYDCENSASNSQKTSVLNVLKSKTHEASVIPILFHVISLIIHVRLIFFLLFIIKSEFVLWDLHSVR